MSRHDELAAIFERDRPRLRRIAHRMLGDWDLADEAVQESWLKTGGIGEQELRNAGAWLTTITTRVCLDKLRQRRRRTPAQRLELDDPKNAGAAASLTGDAGPEHAALTADSIGVALLIVLERLARSSAWPSCCMTCSRCRSRRSPA
jgi:RNA polymerase sigma-70 factor (ECF subfamily)